ncbi:MAG: DUF4157 domain-containing protein [Leptolyngbyaceae cyanobacterium HOT.MB2.61]|nr:DUF4157 domain-containing protein [Leptolyngbyaceae cyanobacterium HOT.MB2.61]
MQQYHPPQSRSLTPQKPSQIARKSQSAAHPTLQLQAAIGNHGVNRAIAFQNSPDYPISNLIKPLFTGLSHELVDQSQAHIIPIQTKLMIAQPGDHYEQEADRIASHVVHRIHQPQSQSDQRQAEISGREGTLQRSPVIHFPSNSLKQQSSPGGVTVRPELEASIKQEYGKGSPLPETIRKPLEQSFGADFSQVRVHTDARSDRLNRTLLSRAFTTQQDIFFRRGLYCPGSRVGQELLAHELTHVVQQNSGVVQQSEQTAPDLMSPQQNQPIITQRSNNTIQRAIGLEIEIPVPIDRLSAADVTNIQNDVQAVAATTNDQVKLQHKFHAKGLRDANGAVPYGTLRRFAGRFRVDADHDDRVMTPNIHGQGWPLREGGKDSIIEIVMDPPAKDVDEFNNTMDLIDAFIDDIETHTNHLTTRWVDGLGPGLSVGPLDYTALGLPVVKQPHHNFKGSVQVNIGIDLREYHSLLKWYANSSYANPSRVPAGQRALYRQIRTDIKQAVTVGRTITRDIYNSMTPLERQQTGNLRGLRGWITHLALYLKRGTIPTGVLGGTAKNIAPVLLKTPNDIAAFYGMTTEEENYFTTNRNHLIDEIFRMTGRGGDVGSVLNTIDAFAASPGIDVDTLSSLTSGLGQVALTGKPIQEATGVGPERQGSPDVQSLPDVPLVDPNTGNPTIGGGPQTRGGIIVEFRTLPGYYEGPDSWRELGLRFLQEAIERNTRSGTEP